MKRLGLIILLCATVLSVSCTAPSLKEGEFSPRSVAVSSDSFSVGAQGEVFLPLAWDEEACVGGGIGAWNGKREQEIPWADTPVSGLTFYEGEWYAWEKASEDCRGDGAQLLRWDASAKEQKRVANLCSCEGSRYLLFGEWVFYTLRCEAEEVTRGLYGYHRSQERYCFFEGEVVGLGLREGVPHYLLLSEEGAVLYRLEEEGDTVQSDPVAAWEKLPLEREALEKGEVFFFDGVAVKVLEQEGLLLLWDNRSEGQFFRARISSAAASENRLFFAVNSSLYRWDVSENSRMLLASLPVKDAKFRLFPLHDGALVLELSNYQAADVLLWRWERQYLMLWQEEQALCILSTRDRVTELSASQLPMGVGFPTLF